MIKGLGMRFDPVHFPVGDSYDADIYSNLLESVKTVHAMIHTQWLVIPLEPQWELPPIRGSGYQITGDE